MALAPRLLGVDSPPIDGTAVPANQKYFDTSCNTPITYSFLNELIAIFNNALTAKGIAIVPNDENALKKIVDAFNANIATIDTSISGIQGDIIALETDVAPLESLSVNQGIDPDTITDDLYKIVDKNNRVITAIRGDLTVYSEAHDQIMAIDPNIAYAVTDNIGRTLFYVDNAGKFYCDLGSVTGRELFYEIGHFFGIMIKGQSNGFAIDATTPYVINLTKSWTHDNGLKIVTQTGIAQPSTTALEPFEGTDTGDTATTNVAHGVCWWLENCGVFNANQSIFVQNSSVPGFSIEQLSKDTVPYNAEITRIGQAKTLAAAINKALYGNVILWIQGESNSINGTSETAYIDLLQKLIDGTSDSIAGNNLRLPIFSYQMGGHENYTNANRLSVVEAAYKAQEKIPYYSCVAPTYILAACPDIGGTTGDDGGVHYDKHGQIHLGLFFGRAIESWLRSKGSFYFKPLQPTKAKKSGLRGIIVDFYVPVAPIQFSTTTVPNTADLMYGLEVWQDGTRVSIASVSIFSENQIYIVTAADITGAVIKVQYAATADAADKGVTIGSGGANYTDYIMGRGRVSDGKKGSRGCICDSATTPSFMTLNDSDGLPFDMRNYCVISTVNVS